ncbi:hypothetical protein D9757_006780 [Collybiopsis confluens]|uniref:Protein kinase domain-containing protein n=1 Tax=Collybiopsis confluens TaxID=2823264 RepID=A0A8H5HLC3_9AGAR|nr:hypothetical protein D9757_006780 [Collybiopsis confluens]
MILKNLGTIQCWRLQPHPYYGLTETVAQTLGPKKSRFHRHQRLQLIYAHQNFQAQHQQPNTLPYAQRYYKESPTAVSDGEEALETMDQLQAELDRAQMENDIQVRASCLKRMQELNRLHGVLPSSMFLRGLHCESKHPITGGGFSDIWVGRLEGRRVCVKVLRFFLQSTDKEGLLKSLSKEVLIWRQLKHPNILPFLGVDKTLFPPSFSIVSPWMDNGDLISYFRKSSLHPSAKLDYIVQIAEGLVYLHELNPPVVHGDLKGANILISDDQVCCLADFGLSILDTQSNNPTHTSTVQGSLRWLAPEYINPSNKPTQMGLTPRDIYAFGCTVFEVNFPLTYVIAPSDGFPVDQLITEQPPFAHHNQDISVAIDVLNGVRPVPPPDIQLSNQVLFGSMQTIFSPCWSEESKARPSARAFQQYGFTPMSHLSHGSDQFPAHRALQRLHASTERQASLPGRIGASGRAGSGLRLSPRSDFARVASFHGNPRDLTPAAGARAPPSPTPYNTRFNASSATVDQSAPSIHGLPTISAPDNDNNRNWYTANAKGGTGTAFGSTGAAPTLTHLPLGPGHVPHPGGSASSDIIRPFPQMQTMAMAQIQPGQIYSGTRIQPFAPESPSHLSPGDGPSGSSTHADVESNLGFSFEEYGLSQSSTEAPDSVKGPPETDHVMFSALSSFVETEEATVSLDFEVEAKVAEQDRSSLYPRLLREEDSLSSLLLPPSQLIPFEPTRRKRLWDADEPSLPQFEGRRDNDGDSIGHSFKKPRMEPSRKGQERLPDSPREHHRDEERSWTSSESSAMGGLPLFTIQSLPLDSPSKMPVMNGLGVYINEGLAPQLEVVGGPFSNAPQKGSQKLYPFSDEEQDEASLQSGTEAGRLIPPGSDVAADVSSPLPRVGLESDGTGHGRKKPERQYTRNSLAKNAGYRSDGREEPSSPAVSPSSHRPTRWGLSHSRSGRFKSIMSESAVAYIEEGRGNRMYVSDRTLDRAAEEVARGYPFGILGSRVETNLRHDKLKGEGLRWDDPVLRYALDGYHERQIRRFQW